MHAQRLSKGSNKLRKLPLCLPFFFLLQVGDDTFDHLATCRLVRLTLKNRGMWRAQRHHLFQTLMVQLGTLRNSGAFILFDLAVQAFEV